MIKLDTEQHQRAVNLIARAFFRAGWTTPEQSQRLAMGALTILGEDFDVSAMDLRDDVTSGNVWPDVTAMLDEMESQTDLADRAIQAALDASPKPHYDYRVAKHQSRGADFGMFGRDYGG